MWAAGQYLYLLVLHSQPHQIACAQHVVLHAGYLFHYFRSEGWVFAVNGRAYLLPAVCRFMREGYRFVETTEEHTLAAVSPLATPWWW